MNIPFFATTPCNITRYFLFNICQTEIWNDDVEYYSSINNKKDHYHSLVCFRVQQFSYEILTNTSYRLYRFIFICGHRKTRTNWRKMIIIIIIIIKKMKIWKNKTYYYHLLVYVYLLHLSNIICKCICSWITIAIIKVRKTEEERKNWVCRMQINKNILTCNIKTF